MSSQAWRIVERKDEQIRRLEDQLEEEVSKRELAEVQLAWVRQGFEEVLVKQELGEWNEAYLLGTGVLAKTKLSGAGELVAEAVEALHAISDSLEDMEEQQWRFEKAKERLSQIWACREDWQRGSGEDRGDA